MHWPLSQVADTGAHVPSGQSWQLASTGQSRSLAQPPGFGVGTQTPSKKSTPHGPPVEMQQGFAFGGGMGQSAGSQAPPPQPGKEPTHLPPMHSTLGHGPRARIEREPN